MSKSNEVYDLVIERLIHADFTFGDRLLVRELAEEGDELAQAMTAAKREVEASTRMQVECICIYI